MNVSEIVAGAILELLDQENGIAQIKRNEFANKIGCVPSQINYVITSRFTPEQGYLVESRRGGGGYIRITRISMDSKTIFMHIVNSIGDSIDYFSARIILSNLCSENYLPESAAKLMLGAFSDYALQDVPQQHRGRIRASILKQMLLAIE